jgi:hypothetical protein
MITEAKARVIAIRHGPTDEARNLTEKGRGIAQKKGEVWGIYGRVKEVNTTDHIRTISTAKAVSGREPVVDPRVGHIGLTPEQKKEWRDKYGTVYESPEYKSLVRFAASAFLSLIEEQLQELEQTQEGGVILNVGHGNVIYKAYQIWELEQQGVTEGIPDGYKEVDYLQGFEATRVEGKTQLKWLAPIDEEKLT